VWIPDVEEVWVKADVTALSGEVEATLEGGEMRNFKVVELFNKIEYASDETNLPIRNKNIGEDGVGDMCDLDHLHEPAVMHNLRVRFKRAMPYTYTGQTCIAVNPFKWIEGLYDTSVRTKYLTLPRNDLPPHIYASSAKAFTEMHSYRQNQSILVSGESGAGKTETVKILMEHLASVSQDQEKSVLLEEMQGVDDEVGELAAKSKEQDTIINRILQANPLLEAFGNAKTSRNDNSSRFGKFVQLQFDFRTRLVGAKTQTYLLEKVRVVWQAEGSTERNFHIFHQLLSASAKERQVLKLQSAEERSTPYRYVNSNGSTKERRAEDEASFTKTKFALKLLAVEMAQQAYLYRMLSGLVNLGEVKFDLMDTSTGGDAGGDNAARSEVRDAASVKVLSHAAAMLGVEPNLLALTLTSRLLVMRGGQSVTRVPLDVVGATNSADATAKHLFDRLFKWLVEQINISTAAKVDGGGNQKLMSIGLLDIFGFESFEHNSFEQLCINYCNETLQQKFCADVFKSVAVEYEKEGIGLLDLSFDDNAAVLDLIEGRMGMLSLLNEECLRPGGSDESFASKFTKTAIQPGAKNVKGAKKPVLKLEKGRDRDDMKFVVVHYAEEVCYDTRGWCEKNKDALLTDMLKVLEKSTSPFVRTLFGGGADGAKKASVAASPPPPGRAKRRGSSLAINTTATQFRAQLKELMLTVGETTVQYIRCIKPNKGKVPAGPCSAGASNFEMQMVMEQLRSAGVVNAVKVSRKTFPTRMLRAEFVQRFGILSDKSAADEEAGLKAMVENCIARYPQPNAPTATKTATGGDSRYAIGKTKLFFAGGVLEALEDGRLEAMLGQVISIQCAARCMIARKKISFRRGTESNIVKLQRWVRCHRQRRRYRLMLRAIVHAQSVYRRRAGKRKVLHVRHRRASIAAADAAAARCEQVAKKQQQEEAEEAAQEARVTAAKRASMVMAAEEAQKVAEKAATEEKAAAKAAEEKEAAKVTEDQKVELAVDKATEEEKQAYADAEKALLATLAKEQKRMEAEKLQREQFPSFAGGDDYEVRFEEGPLGIFFASNVVDAVQPGSQAHKRGVLQGSTVIAVDGEQFVSGFDLGYILSKRTAQVDQFYAQRKLETIATAVTRSFPALLPSMLKGVFNKNGLPDLKLLEGPLNEAAQIFERGRAFIQKHEEKAKKADNQEAVGLKKLMEVRDLRPQKYPLQSEVCGSVDGLVAEAAEAAAVLEQRLVQGKGKGALEWARFVSGGGSSTNANSTMAVNKETETVTVAVPSVRPKQSCIDCAAYRFKADAVAKAAGGGTAAAASAAVATAADGMSMRRLHDAARVVVTLSNCGAMLRAIDLLGKMFTLMAVENRHRSPTILGWSDILLSVSVDLPGPLKEGDGPRVHIAQVVLQHRAFELAEVEARKRVVAIHELLKAEIVPPVKTPVATRADDPLAPVRSEISQRLNDPASGPITMKFRKPKAATKQAELCEQQERKDDEKKGRSRKGAAHRRASVGKPLPRNELEYEVSFGEGPLGIELDRFLGVKGVVKGTQAHTGGVRVGSTMHAVGLVPLTDVASLGAAMKEAKRWRERERGREGENRKSAI
jgi:myosin-5